VAPWDLERMSKKWMYEALAAENAENKAESEAIKRANSRRR
jgi:hypothetical protein